ncbi:MAG: VCBS repeat-containing protein [Pyrinomonadaceae bacterium]
MKISTMGTRIFVSAILFYVLLFSANQTAFSQYECEPNGMSEVRTGGIAAGDPTQTSRVFRDGIPSSCAGGVPTSAPVAGSYRFDQYSFTNPTGLPACVTVELDATACGGTANNSTQINAYSPTFNPANVSTNLVGKPGFSTIATGSLGFSIAAGASFTVVVHEVVAGGGCANYSIRVTYRTGCRQSGFDRSNDGKADPTYFRPSTGTWEVLNSAGGADSRLFGLNGDIITPGDYTGDGQTDVSTYRASVNTWFFATDQSSPQTSVTYVPWGVAGDIPVPGDYDRDGKTDVAVWRPSDGVWYILRSGTNTAQFQKWGVSGDTPITGDYDGDLIGDYAVVRPASGNYRWYILDSNFNTGFQLGCPTTGPICNQGIPFGLTTDRPVSGDFDGDLRTDVAVWRPTDGNWYFWRSGTSTVGNTPGATIGSYQFGLAGDIPQPADYDGDKKTDFAIFRPASGTWWIINSAGNTFTVAQWGMATDEPATSPYRISNP